MSRLSSSGCPADVATSSNGTRLRKLSGTIRTSEERSWASGGIHGGKKTLRFLKSFCQLGPRLSGRLETRRWKSSFWAVEKWFCAMPAESRVIHTAARSEEHTSELQSPYV